MTSKDLKKAGLKVTLPRMRILEILDEMEGHHHTAEDIYRKLLECGEEIGLATVYRVLTQFEAAGLVKRHHFESGQAVFELDRGGHHDHMVSMKSGRVVEFYDELIEKRQHEIAKQHGFRIIEHTLVLYGEFDDEETQATD
ncbi:MAG: ferric iron uptake transcriptional regulator [Thiotrichales bacterium]